MEEVARLVVLPSRHVRIPVVVVGCAVAASLKAVEHPLAAAVLLSVSACPIESIPQHINGRRTKRSKYLRDIRLCHDGALARGLDREMAGCQSSESEG